jgi:WD40 repeat protein
MPFSGKLHLHLGLLFDSVLFLHCWLNAVHGFPFTHPLHLTFGSSPQVWDIANSCIISVFEGHGVLMHALDFSRESRLLACSSDDKTLRIWGMDTEHHKTLSVTRPVDVRVFVTHYDMRNADGSGWVMTGFVHVVLVACAYI